MHPLSLQHFQNIYFSPSLHLPILSHTSPYLSLISIIVLYSYFFLLLSIKSELPTSPIGKCACVNHNWPEWPPPNPPPPLSPGAPISPFTVLDSYHQNRESGFLLLLFKHNSSPLIFYFSVIWNKIDAATGEIQVEALFLQIERSILLWNTQCHCIHRVW